MKIEKVNSPQVVYSYIKNIKVNQPVDVMAGISAVDYASRELTVTISGTVDISKDGNYYIRYSATDEFGNTTVKKKYFKYTNNMQTK